MKVKLKVPFGFNALESHETAEPESLVVVWAIVAVFVQVTFVPTLTVRLAGMKPKLTIETVAPPVWLPGVGDAVALVALVAVAGTLVAVAGATVAVALLAAVVPPQPASVIASVIASAAAQRPPSVAARHERGRVCTTVFANCWKCSRTVYDPFK